MYHPHRARYHPHRARRCRVASVAHEGVAKVVFPMGLALATCGLLAASTAQAQVPGDYGTEERYAPQALTTRVWLDRGDEAVVQRGERARLYYRASHDAFVAVFHIDTNGTTRLLFPRSPDEDGWVRGGRDYRLVFPGSSSWIVADEPGVGYFFSVASPEPLDFRDFGYSSYAGGWDLSHVGSRTFHDPYVAMDEFVARLIPDWEYVAYALDFSTYYVEQRYEYPRFLCYDCHGFRPYSTWNPYLASCTSFRVVVYRDPYYYPATRYRGTQVVYARPPQPGLPRFEFKERARGESAAPLALQRSPTAAPTPLLAPRRDASESRGVSPARPSERGARPVAPAPAAPGAVRPGESRPTRSLTPPAVSRPTDRGSGTLTPPTRPILQRRPTSPATGAPPPPARSGGSTTPPPPARSGGSTTPPPTARPGRSTTPPPRAGGGSARPPVRAGGGVVRPSPARSGGGAVSPPARAGSGAARPPVRAGGGSARPPPKPRGGGGARPLPKPRGGGGSSDN